MQVIFHLHKKKNLQGGGERIDGETLLKNSTSGDITHLLSLAEAWTPVRGGWLLVPPKGKMA